MFFRLIRYCFFLFFLIIAASLYATTKLPFTSLGVDKGLSNNAVRAIFKDSKGFMWFGTRDGLNRYDGYGFKVFRNIIGDEKSLPHNYINTISEDAQHNLWVGTGQGIGIYSPLKGSFTPLYCLRKTDNVRFQLKSPVKRIVATKDGNMIVGTNGSGLIVLSNGNMNAIQIPITSIGGVKITNYNVVEIKPMLDKKIYLLVEGLGLCVYQEKYNEIVVLAKIAETTHCMEMLDSENLLVSTNAGINNFNLRNQKLTFEDSKAISRNSGQISAMYLGRRKQLWIGTTFNGLIVASGIPNKNYLQKEMQVFKDQSIMAIYEDEVGRKWFDTSREGVAILDVEHSQFKTVSRNPLLKTTLVSNFVSSFYEDRSANLWIGTDGGGISIWNKKTDVFKNFRASDNKSTSLRSNAVTSIKEDYNGDVWIATYGGGINKYIGSGKNFKRYPCINQFSGKENVNVWQLMEGRDKMLWASTYSQGKLYFLNRKKDRFEVFDANLEDDFLSLKEDRNSILWGGNYSRLVEIDKRKTNHHYYEIGKPVRVIFEDSFGNLWLGTEGGGLLLFDKQKRKVIKRFSTSNGLCNNAIVGIIESKGSL